MPDITMCTGGNCPLKESCYRYRAVPNKLLQSFMDPPYTQMKIQSDPEFYTSCSSYIEIEPKHRLRKKFDDTDILETSPSTA